MGEDGEELVLGVVGGFGGFLGALEFFLGELAVGDVLVDEDEFLDVAVDVFDGVEKGADPAGGGAFAGGEGGAVVEGAE